MKAKHLLPTILFIALISASCSKGPDINSLIDDKDKIDIKGSLSNGDMRYPNIEAGFFGRTLYVYFHENMGVCTVTVSNLQGVVLYSVEQPTYPYAEVRYFMGDLPMSRYHLVISNGTDEAEGWFNNFRIVAHKP